MKKRSFLLCALVLALMLAFAAPLSAVEFSDVPETEWFAKDIHALADKDILNGYPEGTFGPNDSMKRAEFVKVLAAAANEPVAVYSYVELPFNDTEDHWAKLYIAWAYENDIVNGRDATTFDPDGLITRQEMAVMINRYADYQSFELPEKVEAKEFTDDADIANWAKDAVTAMQQAQIINGYPDDSFCPTGNATRAEASKMINSLYSAVTIVIDFDTIDTLSVEFEDRIFRAPVEIRGDMGIAVFRNCQFYWDITNTADVFTRVILDENCSIRGNVVFDNVTKEADIDYLVPKFVTYFETEAIAEDCIGSVITCGGYDITFNGVTYHMEEDAEWFYDMEQEELVPYEDQEANVFYVGQWWEDGEHYLFLECEYDNTLIRSDAEEYTYDLDEGDTSGCANYNFYEDVYINGDNAQIYFENCAFYGDIIITADEGTRVTLDDLCEVYGNIIFDNDVKVANMDYAMPKVITFTDVTAIAEDCIGTVVACDNAVLNYNGIDYTVADCNKYEDAEGNFVDYIGQEADSIYIGQWWEDGEQVIFKCCFKL